MEPTIATSNTTYTCMEGMGYGVRARWGTELSRAQIQPSQKWYAHGSKKLERDYTYEWRKYKLVTSVRLD